MPRIPRGKVAGHAYHVLNRGNGGATVFHKDGDYTAFLDLLTSAKAKFPVKIFGLCLMPNNFHLLVQPATDAALSPFMQWSMKNTCRDRIDGASRFRNNYVAHESFDRLHVWHK